MRKPFLTVEQGLDLAVLFASQLPLSAGIRAAIRRSKVGSGFSRAILCWEQTQGEKEVMLSLRNRVGRFNLF